MQNLIVSNDLEAIRARANAATPGPWYDNGYCGIFSDHKQEAFGIASIWHERLYGDIPTDQGIADREFITQCRQDVPALCNEVEALRLRIRQLEAYQPKDRVPWEETAEAYNDLIMAVAQKFPGETRHQTALRYIRDRESGSNDQAYAKSEAAP